MLPVCKTMKCTKITYNSPLSAIKSIKEINRRYKKKKKKCRVINYYFCKQHKGYHLTSKGTVLPII